MPVQIKIANTSALLDELYKVRHEVFSTEEGLFAPKPDGRVFDRFDAYPTSTNIVAVIDGRVIGGMRITLDSGIGLHADDYYDYEPMIPAGAARASLGHFCILKQYRSSQVAYALMLMACYYGCSQNTDWVLAPVNPSIGRMLGRIGFNKAGDSFEVPGIASKVLPMILDVRDLQDIFIDFLRQNDLYNFLQSYECHVFNPDETIIRAGDVGDMAYVILEGEVKVLHPVDNSVLATLGEGDIVGELAIFMDDVRTANVVATSPVRAMTLHKDIFLEFLRSNPDEALNQLKLLGRRMKAMVASYG
ncbi:cyclic nucleotide-binding domain-containing protein [Nisaea sp.]|uniref:N-acyl amino acid synthase FeeM domain-containing protein n=1 Tax=Nisaea sp. TaxID=2024842 RepID=UPI003264DAA5